jgi:hypothetical protein
VRRDRLEIWGKERCGIAGTERTHTDLLDSDFNLWRAGDGGGLAVFLQPGQVLADCPG